METGDFFGELGLVAGERTAHVVDGEGLTCLVLAGTPAGPHAGRGAGTTSTAEPPAAGLPRGTSAVDVPSHLHRKLEALARHRTQYPIVPSMLPQSLLQTMLGKSSSAAPSMAARTPPSAGYLPPLSRTPRADRESLMTELTQAASRSGARRTSLPQNHKYVRANPLDPA